MILKKKIKANGAKVMSLLLAAAFLLPLMPVLNVQAAEAVATFENTSECCLASYQKVFGVVWRMCALFGFGQMMTVSSEEASLH